MITIGSCVCLSSKQQLRSLSTKWQYLKTLRRYGTISKRNAMCLYRQNLHQNLEKKHRSCLTFLSRRHIHRTHFLLSAQIIDGKAIAEEIQNEVRSEVKSLVNAQGRPPSLSVILVGKDPASQVYVRNKVKAAAVIGIESEEIKLPASVSQSDLLNTIKHLNVRDDVDAILVQLPLPSHIEERRVCDAVTQEKDVDGFHVVHMGRLLCGVDTILPCTPAAVLEIIKRTGIETSGKKVTVVGRSKHVCLPLAIILQADRTKVVNGGDATVTICHRHTSKDLLRQSTQAADIIISGTGVPQLITGDMVKDGAAVIDVGFARVINQDTGKAQLIGDIDFKGVLDKATYITPVPGGVGPVTVAMLMKNTLRLVKKDYQTLSV